MESLFSRLKVELIYSESFKTVEEAKSEIFQYIVSTKRYSTTGGDATRRWAMSAQIGLSSNLNY